jgi:hypothetical protein
VFIGYHPPESYLTQTRDVALLPREKVIHVFSPQDGLIDEPTGTGRLLITTNLRILSFSQGQDNSETLLVPVEELKGVVVKNGRRNTASLFQGLLMMAGGVIIYLAISYWLTGRFDGPEVPLINLDVGPLIVLLALLGIGWLIGKHYFTREGGSVTFQGSNWTFTFPFMGEKAGAEVYQVVNAVFATRNSRNGYYPPDIPPS